MTGEESYILTQECIIARLLTTQMDVEGSADSAVSMLSEGQIVVLNSSSCFFVFLVCSVTTKSEEQEAKV